MYAGYRQGKSNGLERWEKGRKDGLKEGQLENCLPSPRARDVGWVGLSWKLEDKDAILSYRLQPIRDMSLCLWLRVSAPSTPLA